LKARNYSKRVEFYQTSVVADGVGGGTAGGDSLVATSWANVRTVKGSQRLLDLGVTDPTNTIIVTLRHRNDIDYNAINQYIKYRGLKYIVHNAPANIDFMDVDIEIIAVRQALETV